MTREEAIQHFKDWREVISSGHRKAVIDMAIEALSEPTVIRSRTLLPTKDFKEWAKRIKEVNPNVIVIPCDAEVVSADAVVVVRCKDC